MSNSKVVFIISLTKSTIYKNRCNQNSKSTIFKGLYHTNLLLPPTVALCAGVVLEFLFARNRRLAFDKDKY